MDLMRKFGTIALRCVVFVAGITGVLALFGSAAQAYMPQQHCEPVRRM